MDKSGIYLALDFDGVIADSIYECLVVAHNAFSKYKNAEKFIKTLDEIDALKLKDSRNLRNYIRSGEDYVYIQQILNENVQIINQLEFDEFCALHEDKRELYYQMFYKEREALSINYFKNWIALNPMYDGILDFLQSYPEKKKLFVITTKKIEFAKKIILAHNIGLIESNFYHSSINRSKKQIISKLLKQYNIGPSDFYFIDDQVDTLVKIKGLGINLYLAEWGYNNKAQIKRAKVENIPVLGLKEFITNFKVGFY